MTDTARTAAIPSADAAGLHRLVTRSVAVTPADALDRLGFASGDAGSFLESGEWVGLGPDRVRLVPMLSGDPREAFGYALVETEHANILAGDGPEPLATPVRAA